MKTHPWYLQLSGEIAQALNGHYLPLLQTLMHEMELDGNALYVAQVAQSAAPAPVTPASFLERTPYMAAATMETNLQNAADMGVITAVSDTPHSYHLTEKGWQCARAIPAWRQYELVGYEWEAFSHIHGVYAFGEPAQTEQALAENMGGFRGEAETDRLSNAPWGTLNVPETIAVHDLLTAINETMQSVD